MRLHAKIILLISAVAMSIGLISSILVSRMMHNLLESELRDQAVIAVQSLAEHVTHNVIDGEVIEAREALGKMVERSQSIQYAYIIDFDDRLFAHSFEGGFPKALAVALCSHDPVSAQCPEMVHLKTNTGLVLEVGYPLIKGMAAHVHIGMSEERTHTQIASLRNRIIGLSLLLALAGIAIGTFVKGTLHSKQVARIAELAFMGMFAAWEEFLEDTFIRYLAGASDSGSRWPVLKLGKTDNMRHACKVLSGNPGFDQEKDTMSWTSPQVVIERAEVFFAGGRPYKSCLEQNRSLLEYAKHIRNRTAHSSGRCRRLFQKSGSLSVGSFRRTFVHQRLHCWPATAH